MAFIHTTFKYRLYPTKEQKKVIHFTLERCRLLYNRLLEERILSYNTTGEQMDYAALTKFITGMKQHVPVLKQVHSQILQDVAGRLDKAFKAFFDRLKKGDKPGFPRFKVQARYNSFTFKQGGYSISGNKIKMHKIGEVKIKLHRELLGKIKTCTVTVKNGKYYVSISCEVDAQLLPASDEKIGLDLGIKSLAISSDGEIFDSPTHLRKSTKVLRRLQRSVTRKKIGSNRRRKAVVLLARQHEKVANQRKDHLHKLSRQLVNRYGFIAFEKLNIRNMIKNHNLAKSIADAAWGILVQFTSYKAESAGRIVAQGDPSGTSQDCSECGERVEKSLSERVHRCPWCGYIADRDINAAKNILKRALSRLEPT